MATRGSPRHVSYDAELLRVSKATKSILQFYGEGVHIETHTSRSLSDLQQQVCADRLILAESFLHAGTRFLRMRSPEYRSAISRYYYAMYHTARAVVYHHHGGDDHESHSTLPTKLPRDFTNSALWTNYLKDARNRRNEADYDPYPMGGAPWRPIAANLSTKASDLLALAQSYLQQKGCAYI
ncbi:HEPN domain-containing protein [Micromonospora zamorensis]|uniref:HEPN domain-containing protein n=1 Tax=Micromonospora zamorensis TaxID=709883 RepID=UPI0033A966E2